MWTWIKTAATDTHAAVTEAGVVRFVLAALLVALLLGTCLGGCACSTIHRLTGH